MQILDNLIILLLIVLSFAAGMTIANKNNEKCKLEVKEALEKQYVRLRTKTDADDPVKPYGTYQVVKPIGMNKGNPVPEEFLDELKTTGRAKMILKNGTNNP